MVHTTFARMKNAVPSLLVTTVLLIIQGANSEVHAQGVPLFPGEEYLDSCVVDLPFSAEKKVRQQDIEAARALEEQELVYLTYDKKEKKSRCTRVYVMIDTNDDGSESMYLETTVEHRRADGDKQVYLPKYKANSERFYDAQCFDRALIAHPEVNEYVVITPVKQAHK